MNKRLTRLDWLKHGLVTLSASGFSELKAEPMAKGLGVSRGSFYWHFSNLADFHNQLLDYWQETATEAVIEDLETDTSKALRLEKLMQRAFIVTSRDWRDVEIAIRYWAQYDRSANERLRLIDTMRIEYISKILVANGVAPKKALMRARFVYAASLGDAQVASDAAPIYGTVDIKDFAEFLLT